MVKSVKPQGKAVVQWDAEFAGYAKEAAKGMTVAAGKFISTKSGVLTYAGAKIPDNELRCVVIGSIFENAFYEGDFDPDNPQSPGCFAFGVEKEEMAPSDTVPDKQSEACTGCPKNEFGSAERGQGKACKNVVRLALVAETDLEDLAAAEVVYLKVPVTSVKNWIVYAKKRLAEGVKRPYWAVVTKVAIEPDAKTQHQVTFELAEEGVIEDATLFPVLRDLWTKTMEGIDFPYVATERAAKPVKAARGAKKRKF